DLLELSHPNQVFLPHYRFWKKNGEGAWVVIDSAARFHGKSLNDTLLTGHLLQCEHLDALLRFRENKVAITADIVTMFYRIALKEEDSRCHRFLWRESKDHPLLTYQMSCVDAILFKVNIKSNVVFTRRGLLSELAGLFDQQGLISPVAISGKIKMKELVLQSLEWDGPVSEETKAWVSTLFVAYADARHYQGAEFILPCIRTRICRCSLRQKPGSKLTHRSQISMFKDKSVV
ncbi:hypothetical protein TCAL_12382, partial [Tigriopus californicus]